MEAVYYIYRQADSIPREIPVKDNLKIHKRKKKTPEIKMISREIQGGSSPLAKNPFFNYYIIILSHFEE